MFAARCDAHNVGEWHGVNITRRLASESDSIDGWSDLCGACRDVRGIRSGPAYFDSNSPDAILGVEDGELIKVQRLKSLSSRDRIKEIVDLEQVFCAVNELGSSSRQHPIIGECEVLVHAAWNDWFRKGPLTDTCGILELGDGTADHSTAAGKFSRSLLRKARHESAGAVSSCSDSRLDEKRSHH